ncbi:AfsR/SARP family transcriptional regulator [Amycolatopsis samaneae]|uniref:BTAD domain-containing putative transcriptional regulator n=1 Tax=Amycolatopsis samaneae TaxID=664691 RepID=A0ABW5GJB7_9PSEU
MTIAHSLDTEPRLRFSVLGPLRAWHGDQPLDLGPIRQQALLAALVLRPDMTVSRDELLDGVWGLEPPGTGAKVVPVYVHRLRRCLQAAECAADELIGRSRGGYRFVSGDVWIDADRLEEVVAEAGAAERSGDLPTAVDRYSDALELFQGEPLAGLPGPFAEGQRLRLAERRIVLLQEKVDRQLRLGRHADAVGELSALLPAYPHSEPLAALLMRALYACGRRADALAVYTQLRRRLIDDLGVEPGDELRRVHQDVLRGNDSGLGVGALPTPVTPVPAPPARVRDELPADVAELVGRAAELALLTAPADAGAPAVDAVDGVPGSGKTALAVRVARLVRDRYPDGCLYVDLHGHTEGREALPPQRALRRLLRSVGVDVNNLTDDLDELAASWRAATASRRLLLVLDDVAGAEQVRPLLPAGTGSRVLTTSRRRLAGLDVGRRVSLGPLAPGEAETLLTRIVGQERAEQERDAVRELARLCGRLPLALRIAGARLQNRPMWTLDYLVTRLADGERRLGELTAEDRSVEGAFRLSYEQLPSPERRAFRALGLSPTPTLDGRTLAAMLGWTARDAELALERLVDTSLVQQPSAGRYRLHDLVAVYARRLAGQDPAQVVAGTRAGALRLYLAAGHHASDWGPAGFPTGPDLGPAPFEGWQDAVAWLDAGAGDLADVVAYAVEAGEADYACWIADGLVHYFTRQGRHHECRAALELALPLVSQASDQRMVSSLRIGLGIAYGMQDRYEQSRAWFSDALEISRRAGDPREQARALNGLGVVARLSGRHPESVAHLTRMRELALRLDDDCLAGMAVSDLGAALHCLGRHDEALECFAQSMRYAEKAENPRLIAKILRFTGALHLGLARPAEAAPAFRQAAELAAQVGDPPLHASCLTRWGSAELGLGAVAGALDLHHRALATVTAVAAQTSVELEREIRRRLGEAYVAAGRTSNAWTEFHRALALGRTPGH